jgi:hypothetical protein
MIDLNIKNYIINEYLIHGDISDHLVRQIADSSIRVCYHGYIIALFYNRNNDLVKIDISGICNNPYCEYIN